MSFGFVSVILMQTADHIRISIVYGCLDFYARIITGYARIIHNISCPINPKLYTPLPKLSPSLKAYLKETRDTKFYLNSHPRHKEDEELKEKEIVDKNKEKEPHKSFQWQKPSFLKR
eukprot:227297_1